MLGEITTMYTYQDKLIHTIHKLYIHTIYYTYTFRVLSKLIVKDRR